MRESMPEGPMVSAEVLAQLGAVFLDCRAGPDRGGYDLAHLRGARRAELESDLSAPADPSAGGRHPLPAVADFCATLGRWDLGPDTPVVVYDGSGGGLYAARAWWMLRSLGHTRVWVLDGGFEAAVAAGWPVESEEPAPATRSAYPAERWSWPIVDADQVEQIRADPSWCLVDARSAPRWRGEVEPIDPVAGRIPGSVNLPWESTVGPDGRLLGVGEVAGLLQGVLGDTPPSRLVAQCGSGVTACHTLLQLERVGLGGAALYVGSWSEWCRQDRPRG